MTTYHSRIFVPVSLDLSAHSFLLDCGLCRYSNQSLCKFKMLRTLDLNVDQIKPYRKVLPLSSHL